MLPADDALSIFRSKQGGILVYYAPNPIIIRLNRWVQNNDLIYELLIAIDDAL